MAYNTNADRLANRTVTNLEQSLGKYGCDYVRGSAEATINAKYIALQCVTDCTFTKLNISGTNFFDQTKNLNSAGGALSSNIVFKAGTILFGEIKSLQLNGDNEFLILYKG